MASDDEYIYDEVQIKNIQPGDEILTLNTKTGQLQWQPVLALLDMGEQPVYQLTTQSGKTIRTTGTHPYLTPYGWLRVADLREGNKIAIPKQNALSLAIGSWSGSHLKDANMAVNPIKDYPIISNSEPINFSRLVFDGVSKMKRIARADIKLNFLNNSALNFLRQFSQFFISIFSKAVSNHELYLMPSRRSISFAETLPDFREASISFQNFGEEYSKLSNKSSKASRKRLSASLGSTSIGLVDIVVFVIQNYSSKIAKWLSSELSRQSNDPILWDEIISIEYAGLEQVWDISVKKTHNFIGNDIVAHNTYISATTTIMGNVGIGTTSPTALLHLSSTAAQDLFRIDDNGPGDTSPFVIDQNGNVGINTTSPGAYALNVIGQCVTGDTRLRRRRKRGSRFKVQGSRLNEDEEYIYDEVPIKDIQPGDEILTLETKTGQLEWQPVLALLDMGEQPVYKLTTQSGKTIRTTGNHPYLTEYGWIRVANLRAGDKIAIPRPELLRSIEQIMDLREDASQGLIWQKTEAFANQTLVKGDNLSQLNNRGKWQASRFLVSAIQAIVKFFSGFQMRTDGGDNYILAGAIETTRGNNQGWPLLEGCQVSEREGNQDNITRLIKNHRVYHQDYSKTQKTSRSISIKTNLSGRAARGEAISSRNAVVPLGLTFGLPLLLALMKFWSGWQKFCSSSLNIIAKLKELSNRSEAGDILWDKIVSISYAGVEQVWDISVKNTHNFVGNDIVAHNTYLGATSTLAGHLLPSANLTYDLGSSALKWRNLYVGTTTIGSTITIGSNTFEGSATTTLFTTGNANQLVLGATGNVGIGTTSPSENLHVVGNIRTDAALVIPGSQRSGGGMALGTDGYKYTNRFIDYRETLTLTDNLLMAGMVIAPIGQKTESDYTDTILGASLQAIIGGGNTRNFTNIDGGAIGMESLVFSNSGATGTLTLGIGARLGAGLNAAGMTWNEYRHLLVKNATGVGTLTTQYGIYIENLTKGTSADYGLYIAGADTYAIWADQGTTRFDGSTYLAVDSGNVGIGTTSPTALLHLSSTAAQDLFRVDDNGPGDTSPFVIDQNGNVGINTTSPGAYALNVVGQCVTGDTRLRRRRLRKIKNQKSKIKNIDEYIYDEVPIKDIQPGDEIASLNEKTGKLVWAKVKALMDMGVKPIYKLTTATGKTIRTTGNHPYLLNLKPLSQTSKAKDARYVVGASDSASDIDGAVWVKVAGLLPGDEIGVAPAQPRIGVFVDNANLFYAQKQAGWKVEIKKLKKLFQDLNLQFINYHIAVPDKSDAAYKDSMNYIEKIKADVDLKIKLLKYIPGRVGAKKGDADVDLTIDAVEQLNNFDIAVIVSGDSDYLALRNYLWSQGKEVVFMSFRDNLAFELKKGKYIFMEKVRKLVELGVKINTPEFDLGRTLSVLLYGNENSLSRAKVGDKLVFEKITKIELLPAEQVYDIEVEGTHNFVGNDIVAHNTYFSATTTLAGHFLPSANLTYDLGSSALKWRNLYAGTTTIGSTITIGSNTFEGSATTTLFTTGNANQLVLGATGNIGIGTTGPSSKLAIVGSGTGAGRGFVFTDAGNIERITILDNGRVGIGTTVPNATLHVAGGANVAATMTDYNAPSPNVVTESSYATLSQRGWSLFDHGASNDVWSDWLTDAVQTGWVKYDFGASNAKTIVKYTMRARGDGYGNYHATRSPKDWTLQGSNDDVSYTTLDTRTSQTGWGVAEVRTFTFSNSIPYRYYKLDVTANNGDATLEFSEMELMESSSMDLFVIKASGNVGIGTTGPEGKLHVMTASAGTVTADSGADILVLEDNTDSGLSILTPDANTGRIYFGSPSDNDGAHIKYNYNNNEMLLGTAKTGAKLTIVSGNSATAMTIDSNGNVGIGTTSPARKLEIYDTNAGVDNLLRINNSGGGGISLIGGVSGKEWKIISTSPGQSVTGDLWIMEQGQNAALVVQQTSGNVGIGTTGPAGLLHVSATNQSKALIVDTTTGHVGIGGDPSGNWTAFVTTTGSDIGLAVYGPANLLLRAHNTTGNTFVDIEVDSLGGYLQVDDVNALFLQKTTGNVGIGTTGPLERLEVTGGVRLGQAPTTYTTTTEAISSASTTIPVTSTTGYPSSGTILIDSEAITYATTTATAFGGATRGALGTTAATHSSGATVKNYLFTALATASTPRMVITGEGNVGIGTTGPGLGGGTNQYLTITGSGDNAGAIELQRTTASAVDTATLSMINFYNGVTNVAQIVAQSAGATDSSYLSFRTKLSGGSLATKMRLHDTGGLSLGSTYIDTDPGANNVIIEGNVGIGTTGPKSHLVLEKAANPEFYVTYTGGSEARLTAQSDKVRFGSTTAHPLYLMTGGEEDINIRMMIDSGGNVGISGQYAMTPSASLEILKNGSTDLLMLSSVDANNGDMFIVKNNGNVGIGTTSPSARLDIFRPSSGNIFAISSTTAGDLVIIDNSGNVGIGTTGPGAKLDVAANTGQNTEIIRAVQTNVGNYSVGLGIEDRGAYYGGAIFFDGTKRLVFESTGGVLIGSSFMESNSPTNGLAVEGNVGIGTTGPGTKLTVKQGTNIWSQGLFIENVADTTGLLVYHNGTVSIIASEYITSGAYTPITFQTSGLERVRIDTAGNVGIGTTSPSNILTLGGDRTIYGSGGALIIDSSAHTIQIGSSGTAKEFQVFGNIAAENFYKISSGKDFKVYSSDLTAEIFRMEGDTGNVGIGTTGPKERLEVTGGVRLGQAPTTYTTTTEALSSASTTIPVTSTTGYPSSGTILIDSEAITYATTTATAFGGATRGALGTTAATHSSAATVKNYLFTALATASTPRMVITGDGNVGIGATGPRGKLEIAGKILPAANNTYDLGQYSGETLQWADIWVHDIRTYDGPTEIKEGALVTPQNTGSVALAVKGLASQTGDLFQWKSSSATLGVIDKNGNVGIGTTGPLERLEVTGGLRLGQAPTTYSTTSQAIGSASTSLPVVSTSGYPSSGTILIDSEAITYATTATAFGGATRGALGTTAATHSSGATVKNYLFTALATASTPRMVITGDGNVGIGTMGPAEELHIRAYEPVIRLQSTESGILPTPAILFGQTEGGVWSYTGAIMDGSTGRRDIDITSINQIRLAAGGANQDSAPHIVIDTNGLVGIGTTSPQRSLHILSGAPMMRLESVSATAQAQIEYTRNSVFSWFGPTGSNFDFWVGENIPIRIATNGTQALHIDTSQRVGIGTTTPNERLEVTGGVRLGQAPTTYTTTTEAIGSASTSLPVVSTSNYPSSGTILIDSEAITYATTTATAFGGATRGALGTTAATHTANTTVKNYLFTALATATTPRMVITGDGNVGIGTTSPRGILELASGGTEIFKIGPSTMAGPPSSGYRMDLGGVSLLGWYPGIQFNSYYSSAGNRYTTSNEAAFIIRDAITENRLLIEYAPGGTAGDVFTFSTGISLNSSGNVGIGTTSPASLLEVYSSTADTKLTVTAASSTDPQIVFRTGATPATQALIGIDYSDSNKLKLVRGSDIATSTGITIDSSGNVGIGTTSPSGKLEVVGGKTIVDYGTDKGLWTKDSTGAERRFFFIDGGNTARLFVPNTGGLYITDSSNSNSLGIITNTGNVGIGTTTPEYKLDIVKSANVDGVRVRGSSGFPRFETGESSLGGVVLQWDVTSDRASLGTLNSYASPLDIIGSPLTLNAWGGTNVGIGTTSPSSKLSVYGGMSVGAGYEGTAAPTDGMIIKGNVGIGTTNPNTKLQVYGGSGNLVKLQTTASMGIPGEGIGITFVQSSDLELGRIESITEGSNNVGLRFFTFSYSGAERVRISSTGNVGIGTVSPASLLEVYSSTADTKLTVTAATSTDPQIVFRTGATPATQALIGIDYSDSNKLKLVRGSDIATSTGITIDSSGNVGIGATSPAAKLDIVLGTDQQQGIRISNSSGDEIHGAGTANNMNIRSDADMYLLTGVGKVLRFGSNGVNSQMVLNSGNVGIGTTGPTERLEVTGGARIGQAPTTYTTTTEAIGSASTTIPVTSTTGYPSSGTILIDSEAITYTTTTATAFGGATRGALGTTAAIHSANTTVKNYLFTALANATTPRMVITGEGNVGIGTTSPTAKLEIIGTRARIRADGVTQYAILDFYPNSGNAGSWEIGRSTEADTRFFLYDNGLTGGDGAGWLMYIYHKPANGTGQAYGMTFSPNFSNLNTAGDAYTGLLLNVTDAQAGATGNKFIQDWQVGGSSKMVITNTGNVGIGTTSPASLLHVYGTTTISGNVGIRDNPTASELLRIKATANDQMIIRGVNSAANASIFQVISDATGNGQVNIANSGNTTNIRLHSNDVSYFNGGNVGIGTTSPGARLHVVSNVVDGVIARLQSAVVNGSVMFDMYSEGTGVSQRNWRFQANVATAGDFAILQSTTSTGTPSVNRLHIDPSGNVGIGTTGPNERLEVTGGARIGQAPTTYTTTTQAIGSASTTIPVTSTTGYPSSGTILIDSEAITYATTTATAFGGATRGALGTTAATHTANTTVKNYLFTALATASTPRMVITGDGNVGIGTTSPATLFTVATSTNIFNVLANGNVGIGTTSPAMKLYVNATGDHGYIVADTDTPTIKEAGYKIYKGGVSKWTMYIPPSSNDLRFYDTADDRVTFQSGGNVGIGTTSPSAALHVYGTGNTNAIVEGSSALIGYLQFKGAGASKYYIGHNAGNFVFLSSNGATTQMVINDSTGNVGIGTTSPTALLHLSSTAAQDLFRIDDNGPGDTSPFVIDQNGNVGINTTSPGAYALNVVGQCVTGDTRLRRRRLRKIKNQKSKIKYIYDEVQIKDIQPGDEIASLNEKTGRIVWAKVNALLDMGVKPIYKLTTASGKTIRTTGNHPYYVKNLDFTTKAKPKLTQKLFRFEVDQSVRIEELNKDTIIGLANKENSFTLIVPRRTKRRLYEFFRERGLTKKFAPRIFAAAIVSTLQKSDYKFKELILDIEYPGYEKDIIRFINIFFPEVIVYFGSIGENSLAHFAAYGVFIKKRIADFRTNTPELWQIIKNDPRTVTHLDKSQTIRSPNGSSIDSIVQSKELVKSQGLWIKVFELKEGQEIAVLSKDSQNAIWEKITKIEKLPTEKVYDIEVEGTHNFIGNDIVAHNTYISATTTIMGNVGIGTTSPTSLLHLFANTGGGAIQSLIQNANGWAGLQLQSQTTGDPYLDFIQDTSSRASLWWSRAGQYFGINDKGTNTIINPNGGNVGIGTTSPSYLLHVYRSTDGDVAGFTDANGTCTINPTNTALICTSDIQAKQDITSLSNSLEKILALNPISYHWKNQEDSTWRYGFAAQEVEKVIPELVSTNPDGSKALNYTGFAPFLVAAVQEQQAQIEELKLQLNSLGQIGAEPADSPTFIEKVRQALASLGLFLDNGIAQVQKLVASLVQTQELEIGSLENPSGFTIYDKVTKEPYCVSLENGEFVKTRGKCSELNTPTVGPASAPAPEPAPALEPAPLDSGLSEPTTSPAPSEPAPEPTPTDTTPTEAPAETPSETLTETPTQTETSQPAPSDTGTIEAPTEPSASL